MPGVCWYATGQCWGAYWPTLPGKTRKVKFSANKYGKAQALALAVGARERALEHLDEPFNRKTVKRPARHRPVIEPRPDIRIRRVTVQRGRLRVEHP
jgi:hypothetical protein